MLLSYHEDRELRMVKPPEKAAKPSTSRRANDQDGLRGADRSAAKRTDAPSSSDAEYPTGAAQAASAFDTAPQQALRHVIGGVDPKGRRPWFLSGGLKTPAQIPHEPARTVAVGGVVITPIELRAMLDRIEG